MDIQGFTQDVIEETLRSIDNTRNGARELRSCIERKIRETVFETVRRNLPSTGFLDVCPDTPEQFRIIPKTEAKEKEVILCRS